MSWLCDRCSLKGACSRGESREPVDACLEFAEAVASVGERRVKCDGVGPDGGPCPNSTESPTDWTWGTIIQRGFVDREIHVCTECLVRGLRAIRRRDGL